MQVAEAVELIMVVLLVLEELVVEVMVLLEEVHQDQQQEELTQAEVAEVKVEVLQEMLKRVEKVLLY